MARTKPEHPPVHRTDLLPSNLTVAKRDAVLALLRAYRRGAVLLGREQWRLFFETGRFDKNHCHRARRSLVVVLRVRMSRPTVPLWTQGRHNRFAQIRPDLGKPA